MRKFFMFLGIAIALVTLTAEKCEARTPMEPGQTPACAEGCHDPKPLNPPHSKQPRDKQIRITFGALMSIPKRETEVSFSIGGHTWGPYKYNGEEFRNQSHYASPGTYVSITVRNARVGGHVVGGYTMCYLLQEIRGEVPYEIDRMELSGPGSCTAEGRVQDL